MISFLLKSAVKLVLLSMLLGFVFLVRLQERTLFQHLVRIAESEEAQDLKSEMGSAVNSSSEEMQRKLLEPAEHAFEQASELKDKLP